MPSCFGIGISVLESERKKTSSLINKEREQKNGQPKLETEDEYSSQAAAADVSLAGGNMPNECRHYSGGGGFLEMGDTHYVEDQEYGANNPPKTPASPPSLAMGDGALHLTGSALAPPTPEKEAGLPFTAPEAMRTDVESSVPPPVHFIQDTILYEPHSSLQVDVEAIARIHDESFGGQKDDDGQPPSPRTDHLLLAALECLEASPPSLHMDEPIKLDTLQDFTLDRAVNRRQQSVYSSSEQSLCLEHPVPRPKSGLLKFASNMTKLVFVVIAGGLGGTLALQGLDNSQAIQRRAQKVWNSGSRAHRSIYPKEIMMQLDAQPVFCELRDQAKFELRRC